MLKNSLNSILFIFCFFAVSISYLRIQNTIIGYNIGKLKKAESRFLEENSKLQSQLVSLTNKKNLTILANGKSFNEQKTSVANNEYKKVVKKQNKPNR